MKCLCAGTRHAARLLTRYYENALRPANLTPSQFELLATLIARVSMAQSELVEALTVDQTTLSRNLQVLIARKWVKRGSSKADKRQAIYVCTAEGQKAWRAAVPHWQRAQAAMQEGLGADWQTIWSTLDRLIQVASHEREI